LTVCGITRIELEDLLSERPGPKSHGNLSINTPTGVLKTSRRFKFWLFRPSMNLAL